MKWLIYGGRGWIGQQIVQLLKSNVVSSGDHQVILGQARVNDYISTLTEIQTVQPDRIISTVGRTSGPNCPNIDYLEPKDMLPINLRDNLQGPLNLALICSQLKIHLTYLGTGCIFENQDQDQEQETSSGFTEEDLPNFFGSQYSVVKGLTDQLIRHYPNVLNVRIRMPITADLTHPRNFITKITNYSKVISIPNSMTVLPELLPIMIDMAQRQLTGTINLVNPQTISHGQILHMYQQMIDPHHQWEEITLSQLAQITVAQRSNNWLSTKKLEQLYPQVKPIKQALAQLFSKKF